MRRLMRPQIVIPLLVAYFVIAGFVAGLWFPLFFGGLALMVLAIARAVSARRRQAWALGLAGVAMSTGGYLWTAHPDLLRGGSDDPVVAIPASTPSKSPASKKVTTSPTPTASPTPTLTPTPTPSPTATSGATGQTRTSGNDGYVPPRTQTDVAPQPTASATATSTAPRWTQPAQAPVTRRPVNREPVTQQPADPPPADSGNTTQAPAPETETGPARWPERPATRPAQDPTDATQPVETTQPPAPAAPQEQGTAAEQTAASAQTPA